jgi:predicted short-subunit dehydrogenase-like oxidoreductase (DUF2520 family)
MSGVISSQALKPVQKYGAFTCSIHPLQAFADIKKSLDDLKNTVFSLEGDDRAVDVLEDILKASGNECFIITEDQKKIYHAAACVLSNYLVTLLNYGLSYYELIGIDKNRISKALRPFIQGTIDNVFELGADKALTGPIARGNVQTVRMHLQALEQQKTEVVDMYRRLGLETLALADKNNMHNRKHELYNLLKRGVEDEEQ